MFFKRWGVILGLTILGGLLLGVYGMTRPPDVPLGVTPQGESDSSLVQSTLALAGAISAIGTAIFGVLGKFNDYRKARLEIAEKKLDIIAKKKALDES